MNTTSGFTTFMVVVALALGGCGSDSSGPAKTSPPVAIAAVSGSAQEGQSGQLLAQPLTVKVTDKDGRGVANVLVSYSIASGGGTLSAALDTTDAGGQAAVTWTLGQLLGDGRVEARATGVIAPAVFTATVKAGPPAQLDRVSNLVGSSAAGFELPDSVAIRVSDQFGHAIAGVPVAFAVTSGGGRVSAASKNTGDDGVARVMWTIGTTGVQTLTATSGTLQTQVSGTATTCPEVSLAVGQAMTIQPSAAQCLIVTGSAQRYLVTVTNPSSSASATAGYYARGAGASLSGNTSQGASLRMVPTGLTGAASVLEESEKQALTHGRAMQANYDLMSRLGPVSRSAALRSADLVAQAATPPSVGDMVDLKIPKNFSNLCDNSTNVNPDIGSAKIRGRVVFVGAHSVMVEDSADPLSGRFDTLYAKVGQEFDNVMWNILTTNFGNPLAMDATLNPGAPVGKVFMVFSNTVNRMQSGNLAGFVSSSDFYPLLQCATSNMRPVFYARTPTKDAAGFDTDNTTETPDEWYRTIRTVVQHETKHVASFAEKFARNNGAYPGGGFGSRDQWLEESSAMLAEELYARTIFGYAEFGNVNYRSSLYCEVRPNVTKYTECGPTTKPSALIDHFFYTYGYARNPEGLSIVGPVGSTDFTFYGIGWLFLRWVIDQYATTEPSFLLQMTDQVALAGTDEIEARAGRGFADLLADFSIALALDDYPGFTPLNSKHKLPSWNTRDIFASLNADFPNSFTTATPMNLRPAAFGKFAIDVSSVHGGGMSLIDLNGTQSAKQLLEFKGPSGTAFPQELRVSVVRVQ